LQGDLGTSIAYGDPVIDILAGALPWTVFIMSIALTVTFVLGVTLGAFMAYNEGGRFDLVSTLLSVPLLTVLIAVLESGVVV